MQNIEQSDRDGAELASQVSQLNQQLAHAQHAQTVHQRSLRWLLGSIRAEMRRRWQSRGGG